MNIPEPIKIARLDRHRCFVFVSLDSKGEQMVKYIVRLWWQSLCRVYGIPGRKEHTEDARRMGWRGVSYCQA